MSWFFDGFMANALPRTPSGAQPAHPSRPVIALSGDGGIAMLGGDSCASRQRRLPVKVVVFNNGALGFVELEMKAAGIVASGADLDDADYAGSRGRPGCSASGLSTTISWRTR